jgi:hypothetical protein
LPEESERASQTDEGIIYARRIHQSVTRMIEQNSFY